MTNDNFVSLIEDFVRVLFDNPQQLTITDIVTPYGIEPLSETTKLAMFFARLVMTEDDPVDALIKLEHQSSADWLARS
jgi:hypothetical protein